ncbi:MULTISPECIES: recombinase family protein [unclassified Parafrankia]|uniref:recombinase family protein n=1 Tax=unclassified Parafrankia TaxID=2994368 RepID=UPI000DA52746|nr:MULTISPECIES: recombinase family protein [unclassified Parafrankia]TCJ40614.1 hypothetical protein E0504_04660 [Parafrankia sp. BMG5.11]SQD94120.1 conserved hypothetical protein [Parafrankia sp. Ea1.12]
MSPRVHVAYLRRSVIKGGRAADIPAQRRLITRWAEREGITIVAWFVDASITASKSDVNRPDYNRMIQFIRDGHANSIIAVEASRITRQVRQGEDIADLLRSSRGVIVIPNQATYDPSTTNGYGDWLGQFTDAVKESLAKSKRATDWHGDKREDLDYAGSPPPYGWVKVVHLDGHNVVTSWEIEPAQAKIIHEIASRIRGGEAIYGICKDLNARGVPGPRFARTGPDEELRRSTWILSTVRNLIRNPRLAGYRAVREVEPDGSRGTWRILGKPNPDVARKWFEPILTDDEWSETVAAMRTGSSRKATGGRVKNLLAGFVVCAECRARCIKGDKQWKHPTNEVSRRRTKECSARMSIWDADLTALIEDLVSRRLASGEWRADTPGEPALLAEVRRIEGQQAEIDAAVISGEMGAVHAGRLHKALDERLSVLQQQIGATRRTAVVLDPNQAMRQWNAPEPEQGTPAWQAWLTARRVVLAELIERIEIAPGLQGRGPFDPDRVHVAWRNEESTA